MNIKPAALVKITLFVVLGILFGTVMTVYSHSRNQNWDEAGVMKNEFRSLFGTTEDKNRHFEKTFTVSEGGKLIVEASVGTVEIATWDKNEVEAIVNINGNDRRVDKYEVEFLQEGNTVKVLGKYNDGNFFKWNFGNIDAKFVITVPKKFSASAHTSGGDMSIRNLTGDVNFETSGGRIEAESITGRTDLNTSGGDIRAKSIQGTLKAETSGGNIDFREITGDLDVKTSGGNMNFDDIDGGIHAETSGGDVTIKLKNDNKGVEAQTSGGNIYLSLKEHITATVDASTTGGSVHCELPITVKGSVKDSELRGKINGGGNTIRLETSGGDITISSYK